MAREIIIDEDTTVGYIYEDQDFFITNKGTTVTRKTAEEIYNILNIVAPTQTLTNLEEIQQLPYIVEYLHELYYTWEDTGAYIKTIQLNSYEKHPLTLDLQVQKLYVMNSDLIFDLTLNETPSYRIPYLIDYYKDKLGLTVTQAQMQTLYLKLLSYYTPTFYPVIQSRTSTDKALFYTNTIKLSNYNSKAPLTYTLQYNPNNVYEEGTSLADIVYINANTRTIQLRTSIPSSLRVEDKILITDSTVGEFTADGIYTIQGLDTEANIIQVEEFIPNSYEVQYLTCYKVISKTTISSINRDNFSITLPNNVPNTIVIGDIIHLKGTTQSIEGEQITADGTYTVANIQGNTIIVSEQIPINYIGSTAYIYKQIPIGYISTVATNQVTLYSEPTSSVASSDQITIQENIYTVSAYNNKVITLTTQPPSYTQPFAHLRLPVQQPLTEVTIENSTLTNIPDGSFIVDTFAQAIGYTSLITPQYNLPSEYEEDMSNRVATEGAVTVTGSSQQGLITTIVGQCRGLYTEVYTDMTLTN